jgi:WD40 repeat protein
MTRAAPLFVLLVLAPTAPAAELPPGALARLGDDSFRPGGYVSRVLFSPDGKRFVTFQSDNVRTAILVWDAVTGQPVREHEVNTELSKQGTFGCMTWGSRGGYAVFRRGELGKAGTPARVFPDDFCVWEFTDPKSNPPPVLFRALPTFRLAVDRAPADFEYTAFHPSADGDRVAAVWKSSAGKHGVHVYELKAAESAAKLKRVCAIDLGGEGVERVGISADGKTVVTFRALSNPDAKEYAATVWDVTTGKPAKPVRVGSGETGRLTPDARTLFAFVSDGPEWGFDAYDLATGRRRKVIRWPEVARTGDETHEWDLAFSPDGRELYVARADRTHVVDLTTGRERGHLKGHHGIVRCLAVSADGTRVASVNWGVIRLWDAKSLRPLNEATGHRAPVVYAELTPDGKRLLTWAADETARLWDLATGKELRTFAGVPEVGLTLSDESRPALTPDGTKFLYSTAERMVARDLQTGLEVPLPDGLAKQKSRGIVFAPDGQSVLTWGSLANESAPPFALDVWEWPGGKKRASWTTDAVPIRPRFSPDGGAIFEGAGSSERRDARTGKALAELKADGGIGVLSLRPNTRWALAPDGDASAAGVEAGTGNRRLQFRFGAGHSAKPSDDTLALSPLGTQYAQVEESSIENWSWTDDPYLYESATCERRRKLLGHRGGSRVLGFTPDGSRLLTAGGDTTVLVWDVRLPSVPLPDALKKETDAGKLWATLSTGKADAAYLAMARLAREPEAAVKLVKMKLKPATKGGSEAEAADVADARAIELLAAFDSADARAYLKDLAGGHADAFRTQEAKRALERNKR